MTQTAPPEVELTLLERYTAMAELTAEELIARGEQLVRLGQRLAALGMGIVPELPAAQAGGARSVGRLGVVNEATAIQVAATLKAFDRPAFAEALGLKIGSTSKWLAILMHHDPPIIERSEHGGYAYIEPPKTAPRARPRRAPAEAQVIDQSIARGQPIPVAPVKRVADRRTLSRPKQGHHVRQAQKQFKRLNPKEAGEATRRSARQKAADAKRNGHGPA